MNRSRSFSLSRVKGFVERQLDNSDLNTETVARGTGLSVRYINELFHAEDTSLMRYVWQRRLTRCHHDLANSRYSGRSVSETALRWGFNDFSHFSRAFKNKYGLPPSAVKNIHPAPKSEA